MIVCFQAGIGDAIDILSRISIFEIVYRWPTIDWCFPGSKVELLFPRFVSFSSLDYSLFVTGPPRLQVHRYPSMSALACHYRRPSPLPARPSYVYARLL